VSRFKNSNKEKHLASIPKTSLDNDEDKLTIKSKFNFSYMDFSQFGQRFEDWNLVQLQKLLNKLVEYSRESLNHWAQQRIGAKNNTVLEVYGNLPKKTKCNKWPEHVPHQAQWARFRLEGRARLVGFVLPNEYSGKSHSKTGKQFDCNTFYVVFLDLMHEFYLL